jgi:hypothetical protein
MALADWYDSGHGIVETWEKTWEEDEAVYEAYKLQRCVFWQREKYPILPFLKPNPLTST